MNGSNLRWTLAELLPELGCLDTTEVTGLTQDSRTVESGDLFVARTGLQTDGAEYARDAVQRGAVAILLETDKTSAQYLGSILHVPVIPWESERLSLGVLADRFFQSPSRKLQVIGITGTNGKTSSAHFCSQVCNSLGRRTAMIGTLGNGFLDSLEAATHTTPDAVSLHRMIAEYESQGAQMVVMEVSSHAIDQGRIDGIDFDAVGYTNLTRDHLDYHGSEEAYAAAKARLFTDFNVRRQVLNADDLRPAALLCTPAAGVDRIGFSLSDQTQVVALVAKVLRTSGMDLEIKLGANKLKLELPLLGEFNISNLLLVTGLLHQLGYRAEQLEPALNKVQPVEGRMQRLINSKGPVVLVDYAHTPDALVKALSACRAHMSEGRLAVLFGCGGDRDRGKRPLMAAAAEQGADLVWLTSDNPRTEHPEQIISDALRGFSENVQLVTEVDRGRAIASIISATGEGDIVLLAGKGHETYQEINGERLPFSDASVATDALRAGGYL